MLPTKIVDSAGSAREAASAMTRANPSTVEEPPFDRGGLVSCRDSFARAALALSCPRSCRR